MKPSGDLYAIDTNVIVRYLAPEDGELTDKAEQILDAVADGRLTVWCDPVILAEVVWVLRSFYRLRESEIAAALDPLLHCDSFVVPDKRKYQAATEMYGRSVAHFADCCACVSAMEESEGRLLSFDRKLSRVEGIHRLESLDQ